MFPRRHVSDNVAPMKHLSGEVNHLSSVRPPAICHRGKTSTSSSIDEVQSHQQPSTSVDDVQSHQQPSTSVDDVQSHQQPSTSVDDVQSHQQPSTSVDDVQSHQQPSTSVDDVQSHQQPSTSVDDVQSHQQPSTSVDDVQNRTQTDTLSSPPRTVWVELYKFAKEQAPRCNMTLHSFRMLHIEKYEHLAARWPSLASISCTLRNMNTTLQYDPM